MENATKMPGQCQACAAEYYIYIAACILKYFNFNICKIVKYKVIKSCKNPNVFKISARLEKNLKFEV